MAALLLLLLSSVGALLLVSDAQEAYDKLPQAYRAGVDLALEKLNSHAGIQHHFLYFRSITKSDIEVLVQSDLWLCIYWLCSWLITGSFCDKLWLISSGKRAYQRISCKRFPSWTSCSDLTLLFLLSLALMWATSTTTSTLKPPSAREEPWTPRRVASGTTGWVWPDFRSRCSTEECV